MSNLLFFKSFVNSSLFSIEAVPINIGWPLDLTLSLSYTGSYSSSFLPLRVSFPFHSFSSFTGEPFVWVWNYLPGPYSLGTPVGFRPWGAPCGTWPLFPYLSQGVLWKGFSPAKGRGSPLVVF